MSTKPLTQEELRQLNQDTRDSIRGKNGRPRGNIEFGDVPDHVLNFQENDYNNNQE